MNDKKKITIIGVTGVSMLIAAIAAPLALKNSGGFRLRAEPQSHTIYITSLNYADSIAYPDIYDLSFNETFKSSDGETQPLEFYQENCYAGADDKSMLSFNTDGCLIVGQKDSNAYGMVSFYIHFDFAYLDTEQSRVEVYHGEIKDSNYHSFPFYESYSGEPGYEDYIAYSSSFYSGFDDETYHEVFYVKQIKLVFTCLA